MLLMAEWEGGLNDYLNAHCWEKIKTALDLRHLYYPDMGMTFSLAIISARTGQGANQEVE